MSRAHNFINMEGRRFGRLLVHGISHKERRLVYWRCECDCGESTVISGASLRKGLSQSCGCLSAELAATRAATHGGSRTPEYNCWTAMKTRCLNPHSEDFSNYGGRGITIAPRWLGRQGFQNFLTDMGKRPSVKHSIERTDTNGNYEPENCVWATSREQTRNYRKNIMVEIQGQQLCLKDACALAGVSYMMVYQRLKRGWPITDAIYKEPRR